MIEFTVNEQQKAILARHAEIRARRQKRIENEMENIETKTTDMTKKKKKKMNRKATKLPSILFSETIGEDEICEIDEIAVKNQSLL